MQLHGAEEGLIMPFLLAVVEVVAIANPQPRGPALVPGGMLGRNDPSRHLTRPS
jgi:hypothetical protein